MVLCLRYQVDEGVLLVLSVNRSDQGVYTCIARTHMDQTTASAVLTVLGNCASQQHAMHTVLVFMVY